MRAACSFAWLEATTLLQAAHSSHHIGTFENFYQLVEDTLTILRPGLQVFFQYELRLANRLNSQLLISHTRYSLLTAPPLEKEGKSRPHLGFSPLFLQSSINFYFSVWQEPCRTMRMELGLLGTDGLWP